MRKIDFIRLSCKNVNYLHFNVPQDVSQDAPQDKLDVQIVDMIVKIAKLVQRK